MNAADFKRHGDLVEGDGTDYAVSAEYMRRKIETRMWNVEKTATAAFDTSIFAVGVAIGTFCALIIVVVVALT